MDDIIAVLPSQIDGIGIGCEIYYKSFIKKDERSCNLFLKHLCDKRAISVKLMRKKMKNILNISRNLPFYIDSLNVFFPFKIRQTDIDDFRRGFVNVSYVVDIKNSNIYLKNGSILYTLNNDKALWSNFNHARQILYMSLAKDAQKLGKSIKLYQSLDVLDF